MIVLYFIALGFIIYLFVSFLPIILPFVAIYIAYKIVCFLFFGKDGINVFNKDETQEKILPPSSKFTSKDIKNMNPKELEVLVTNFLIQEKFLPPTPKFTSKDIRDMNPRDFEIFIANIFSDNGYSTKVTQYTSDGGKDIIIKKNGITYYVECKHWESAVGRPELQKLVGAAVGNAVSDLIFISTGGFNVNARGCW